MIFDQKKVRTFGSAGSTIGALWVSTRTITRAKPIAAVAKARRVDQSDHPHSWPFTNAEASAPSPSTSTSAPTGSGIRPAAASLDSGTRYTAPIRAITPTGTFTRNTHCQDSFTSAPPTTGPMAAARDVEVAQIFTISAAPRRGQRAPER
nr:hypothetical protein [Nocardia acidivorans]